MIRRPQATDGAPARGAHDSRRSEAITLTESEHQGSGLRDGVRVRPVDATHVPGTVHRSTTSHVTESHPRTGVPAVETTHGGLQLNSPVAKPRGASIASDATRGALHHGSRAVPGITRDPLGSGGQSWLDTKPDLRPLSPFHGSQTIPGGDLHIEIVPAPGPVKPPSKIIVGPGPYGDKAIDKAVTKASKHRMQQEQKALAAQMKKDPHHAREAWNKYFEQHEYYVGPDGRAYRAERSTSGDVTVRRYTEHYEKGSSVPALEVASSIAFENGMLKAVDEARNTNGSNTSTMTRWTDVDGRLIKAHSSTKQTAHDDKSKATTVQSSEVEYDAKMRPVHVDTTMRVDSDEASPNAVHSSMTMHADYADGHKVHEQKEIELHSPDRDITQSVEQRWNTAGQRTYVDTHERMQVREQRKMADGTMATVNIDRQSSSHLDGKGRSIEGREPHRELDEMQSISIPGHGITTDYPLEIKTHRYGTADDGVWSWGQTNVSFIKHGAGSDTNTVFAIYQPGPDGMPEDWSRPVYTSTDTHVSFIEGLHEALDASLGWVAGVLDMASVGVLAIPVVGEVAAPVLAAAGEGVSAANAMLKLWDWHDGRNDFTDVAVAGLGMIPFGGLMGKLGEKLLKGGDAVTKLGKGADWSFRFESWFEVLSAVFSSDDIDLSEYLQLLGQPGAATG